jgi:FkbM family methyltransferase
MGANSAARRVVKKLLYPVLNEHTYQYLQAASKAWDIRSGSWSEPELDLIRYAVEPGDTALDVGANFGVYSYHLSRRLGRAGRVYAFEPVPFTHQTLARVARLLRMRNVVVVPKGCSDRAGEITFSVPVQDSGALSAGIAYIGGRNDDREGKEGQVRWSSTRDVKGEVVALDEFLPPLERLSLVKMDIEGAEMFALRGAAKIFDRHLPTVIIEINPWYLGGFNVKLEDLTNFFFDRGYDLYHYDGKLHPVQVADIVEDNYVFVHPTRKARFTDLL